MTEEHPLTEELEERIAESYHEHSEVICDGCNQTVDLSNADDLNEAIEIWNNHVKDESIHAESA